MTTQRIDPWRGMNLLPTQSRFVRSTAKYRLYSGGYGSGKSKLGCRCSIRRALGWPHSRHLIGRYTYQDLTKTTMVTFWRECREIGLQEKVHYTYSKADMTVRWWNGAETLFSNLDDPTGAKFGSLEISSVFIDEGSEVGSEVYQVLFPGRLRWHLPGCDLKGKIDAWMAVNPDEPVPASMRCGCMDIWQGDICTNPGPSDYLMQVVEEGMPGWEVFHATPGENPYNGPEYYRELEEKGKRYGEHWYKRFFLGRWDAFEGQRFPMLDEQTHTLPEGFTFNTDAWDFYEGWDFGWNAPTAVVVIAVHRNGDYPPCVVAEYERNHLEPVHHAAAIREIRTEFEGTTEPLAYGDPAGLQTNTAGQTTLELYSDQGIYISPATWAKDPRGRADKLGAAFVREVSTPDGPMRGLMFHPRCQRLFRALTMYRFAPNRNKDADAREVFVKKNDHLVDALGYGFAGIFPEAEPEESEAKRVWEADNKRLRRPTMAELDALELGAAR